MKYSQVIEKMPEGMYLWHSYRDRPDDEISEAIDAILPDGNTYTFGVKEGNEFTLLEEWDIELIDYEYLNAKEVKKMIEDARIFEKLG